MLSSKTVAITGGAGGIGKATAFAFLNAGVKKLFIGDIDVFTGREVQKELNDEFGCNRVEFIKTDVTSIASFSDYLEEVKNNSGKIDILFNNAGVLETNSTIDVNLLGCLNGISLAENYMGTRNGNHGGTIINSASTMAFNGLASFPSYVASSHAIVNATKLYGQADFYKTHGLTVMAICPGLTSTKFLQHEISEDLQKEFKRAADEGNFRMQEAQVVGKCVLQALDAGENGSIWICEDNEIYQIETPHYSNFRKHANLKLKYYQI